MAENPKPFVVYTIFFLSYLKTEALGPYASYVHYVAGNFGTHYTYILPLISPTAIAGRTTRNPSEVEVFPQFQKIYEEVVGEMELLSM